MVFFRIVLIIIGILLNFSIFSQNFNQPTVNVLYKMEENERLLLKNFYSEKLNDKIKFAALTYDYEKQEYNFILNEEKIQTFRTEQENYFPFDFFYLDLLKEKSYGFIYDDSGKIYINLSGKKIENINNPEKLILQNNNLAFIYCLNKQYFVYINGKKFGACLKVNDLKYTKTGKFMFSYCDKNNDSWYVNVNNIVYGPYPSIIAIDISETGIFAFNYKDSDGLYYINKNGKILGPYQAISCSLKIIDNNNFALAYRNNDSWLINVSGKIVTDFSKVSLIEDVYIDAFGVYGIKYKQKQKTEYSINGKIVDSVMYYNFKNIDFPKNYFSFEYPENITIKSSNGIHILKSDIQTNSVEVDGKRYGFAFAISAYYNEKNNTFVWNSVENNELVNYEILLQ